MAALLLAIGIVFWLSDPAFAEADGPDYFAVSGVAPGDVLNIRSEPSATASKIGEIPSGAGGLKNLGCEGGLSFSEWETASIEERVKAAESRFCQIEYNGMIGWVAGWYLIESAGPGPAFDCSAAEGSVEEAICADPWLAELDREVTRLYDLALSEPDLISDQLSLLKAYQRGWIKGRNDCWKADDQRSCIAVSYAMRISEIRMQSANAQSQDDLGISAGPFVYACDGEDVSLSLTAINAVPEIATLFWQENKVVLMRVRSASGELYETAEGDMSFWSKGDEALLTMRDLPDQSCMKFP